MKLVNLTPHEINLYADGVEIASIPSSGNVRLTTKRKIVESIDGIDFYRTDIGSVEGLPAPQEGVRYIVSGLVRAAVEMASEGRAWQPC